MRMVLLGGPPGVGKTAAAREALRLAAGGSILMQWIDVDALWAHQPWRVDETMIAMLEANLSAVIRNASSSGVDILLVTWVFQETAFHDMLRRLAPDGTEIMTVQLRVSEAEWRQRFADDCSRPLIDTFFLDRYRAAQTTSADRVIDTTGLDRASVARAVAQAIGI